jgi:hypothetical protein
VAGQEGDPPAPDVADGDGRRRRPVGRVESDLDRVVEEGVEPGAAEDPDLGCRRGDIPAPGRRGGRAHAILLSVFLELLSDEEPEDDESDLDDEESDLDDEESEEDDEESEDDEELVSFSLVFFPLPRLSVL